METEREKHNKKVAESYSPIDRKEATREENYLIRMPIYRAMNWGRK